MENETEPLPPKKQVNKKVIAFVIVLVILLASLSYVIKINLEPNNPNDPKFYDRYQTTPYDLTFVIIESSTLLWGNYTDYIRNIDLLAVQISPTIQDLANGFNESHPDDIVQQTKAVYDYVAEEIDYVDNGLYESPYPDTTLSTKGGTCGDYASLLASLLYALGLEDVAIVYTAGNFNGTIHTHAYVAVKIPLYSPSQNSVQEKIESYLGEGWIGLDPTNSLDGRYRDFAELDPNYELHWNITQIVGVPVYGAVFTFNFPRSFVSYDTKLGYYFDIECKLYAFEHNLDNDVTFTFELREHDVVIDTEVINVTCGQDRLTEVEFELGYLEDFNQDDYWNNVEIYLIITP